MRLGKGQHQLSALSTVVTAWCVIKAVTCTLLGLAILAGGPDHFIAPSLRVAALFVPWWVWGSGFLLSGLLWLTGTLARHARTALAASLLPALMFGTFSTSIGIAVLRPGSGLPWTGVVIYGGTAFSCAMAGTFARLVYQAEHNWFGAPR